ncbi:MAG: DMT family transporter [Sulfitobacter sp.]|jgi:drug/metabolite transporter (DMT)-like permease|nr:EamA family transporter [Roseobacter sp.]MBV47929.1 EamA family transporter [Roseobacter sp.]PHR09232.1 MAG: EamA family transporter [Sulfitobacter sp.]|tara:strand:- start:4453 stop:5379 length:927 start_codon:yes stop_codon:yes gene_type:complete
MTTDRPLIGISLMLGFCIVAPFGDAVAKLLGASVPLAQVVLIRFAVQLIILAPLVWLSRRPLRIRGVVLWLTVLRTLLHIAGIAAMFTALKYLPLADAVAIVFVMPFFMLILGKFVLSEEVGGRRLLACVAGFGGTLLIVQPSFSEVGWPAILPVFVAANFSVFILVTRKIAKHTDPISLQAVSGAMAVALMVPVIWGGEKLGIGAFTMITPNTDQWFLLLAIGILGSLAHLLMTWSLRYAPAATLAPMQYLEIPIATLIGLLIFNDFPDGWAMVGIAVTMAAGVYILIREGAIQRRLDAIKPQQPAE